MTNRLAQTQSLYLQKHAENPIDWWPWCSEALDKAKREQKPIFLSIGYSSCHWCTVMEGEAFSDEAIANYMNTYFVPIKVDREERPDLDSIYMQALQLMTGQGGWPLNVFLSPDDLVPFYGGTYFPLDAKYGRPGFLQVLQAIRQFYDRETVKVQSVKEEILERLRQPGAVPMADALTPGLLQTGLDYSAGILASKGMGPRFPMIPYANTALRGTRLEAENPRVDARAACQQRGIDLVLGGIYDHVGGGFHRYTVDPSWTVPHFEKMLYDNGQVLEYLADLWSCGVREPAIKRSIAGTVEWLQREMTAPDGFFYAAQDADSFYTSADVEPEEGAFYVWSYAQLTELLTTEQLEAVSQAFTVSPVGNFEGRNVLQRYHAGALPEEVKNAIATLFTARYGTASIDTPTFPPARNNQEAKTHPWPGRIPPVTDTKMIVAWNSLMISGLARTAVALQRPTDWILAANAADFIYRHQTVEGRFHRLNYNGQAHVIAQSEDYALFIKALLDLDQAALFTQPEKSANSATTVERSQWLEWAIALQEEFDQHLWSIELGGYFNTDASPDLVVRERSVDDNATPSANGIAIANLVRLALLTEDLSYLDKAEQALKAFSGIMQRAPQSCPTLFVALDWWQNYTFVRSTADGLNALSDRYLPTVVFKQEAMSPGIVALVCQGLSCNEPAQSIEQFVEQTLDSMNRGL